ncbi:hypothetical protein LINGRAHAP2_LOCUS6524, partial [Linum grandiflorum]
FPNGTFLSAKKGSSHSWGWSSILHGRDLLLAGSRWMVGSGTNISPLLDNWLPTSPPTAPSPLPLTSVVPPAVSSLISNGRWDEPLLRSLFTPISVQSILSIPLPLGDIPDAWVWHYTPTGLYTVSSGYRLSQASRVSITSTIGPMLVDSHLWAKLWSSPIQPKLNNFIWKVFHNILPLREALARRSVDVTLNCPVCGQEVETIHHLFQRCVVAQQWGNLMGCQSFLLDLHPIALWRRLHDDNPSQAYKLIYFWWRLWKGRNTVVFEQYQIAIPCLARYFAHHWAKAEPLLHQVAHPSATSSQVPRQYVPANPAWTFQSMLQCMLQRTQGPDMGVWVWFCTQLTAPY